MASARNRIVILLSVLTLSVLGLSGPAAAAAAPPAAESIFGVDTVVVLVGLVGHRFRRQHQAELDALAPEAADQGVGVLHAELGLGQLDQQTTVQRVDA